MAQTNFQFSRFAFFLRRQVALHLPALLLGLGGLFGVLLLISMATALFNPEGMQDLVPFYLVFLFVSGCLITGRALAELNNPKQAVHFLRLPVSPLEKLLALWLLTSPAFVVVYLLLADIAFQFSLWKTGNLRLLAALFNQDTFNIIGLYFVVQAVFFLGACTFRSNSFFKTVLSLLFFVIGAGLFSAGVIILLFRGVFEIDSFDGNSLWQGPLPAGLIHLHYMLVPFFMLVAYHKLKERQV